MYIFILESQSFCEESCLVNFIKIYCKFALNSYKKVSLNLIKINEFIYNKNLSLIY